MDNTETTSTTTTPTCTAAPSAATPPPYVPEEESAKEPGLYQSAAIEAAAQAAKEGESPLNSYPAFLYTPRRSFWDD
ncbi:MAG: hypothetical protein K2M06_03955 [Muribaculaceae bacterium]|nr:hypothetical protein [Muribaculaceae bacterium]